MRRCFSHGAIGHGTVVSVRITVLGCSGSVVGPDSPASGYLLRAPDTPPLVLDFGGGVLGALQRHADPGVGARAACRICTPTTAWICRDCSSGVVTTRRAPPARRCCTARATPGRGWARRRRPTAARSTTARDIFDVRHWVDGEPVTDRRAHGGAAGGGSPDRVLRLADHRSQRCDVRLQRRHRHLRPAHRAGTRRRRFPLRGLLDALRRTVRRRCICRAPRPAGPPRRPGFASCC